MHSEVNVTVKAEIRHLGTITESLHKKSRSIDMWAIIGTVFTGAIISYFEIPQLFKNKCWREISVFILLLLVGMTLSILLIKDVTIPNPLEWITNIYNPFTSFMERILS